MIKKWLLLFCLILVISVAFSLCSCKKEINNCSNPTTGTTPPHPNTKIDGISFVSPPNYFEENYFNYIDSVGANWMAISPFAFSYSNTSAEVQFNANGQWWGERPDGVRTLIDYCQNNNIKAMLKPQVWIPGGWVGDFELTNETDWQTWETTYREYIMLFVNIAIEKDVEIFCIGTEYKKAATLRPNFWQQLITDIKVIYSGKLTYAANWDNYQYIPFWSELDYIGIDTYFPLVDAQTPTLNQLTSAWQPLKEQLSLFSNQSNKQIMFCEFGYMSCDYTAWKNWENENNIENLNVNLTAQKNAFEAFFTNIWNEEWFAGGFIWKWHYDYPNMGGLNDKQYTPQNKPAENIIKAWYEE